ncbi:MAG: hypothetical protein CMJ46_09035 [Planctomyces sp.]|nr:hypothetical protein [Planctomyces sp.]
MFTRLFIHSIVLFSFATPLFAAEVDISRIGTIEGATVTLHPGEQVLNGQVIIPESISLIRTFRWREIMTDPPSGSNLNC